MDATQLRADVKDHLSHTHASIIAIHRGPPPEKRSHRAVDLLPDEDLPILLAQLQRVERCIADGTTYRVSDAESAVNQRFQAALQRIDEELWQEVLRDHDRRKEAANERT